MPVIALQGIRGGTGVTSVAAGLAWALQQLNESVLIIDFAPDNLLRLHFNMPFEEAQGFACSWQDQNWQQYVRIYTPRLSYIPFGKISRTQRVTLENELQNNTDFCRKNIDRLCSIHAWQWILIDLPTDRTLLTQQALELATTVFILLTPDVNCHIRLHQQHRPARSWFLLNQYSPLKSLQKDLCELWQQILPELLPVVLHNDESLAEALAVKKPVTELAQWCLDHPSGNRQ